MPLRHIAILTFCATFTWGGQADKKKDPAEIGNRKVAGGPNFYSLEKELALGRQLALEVERQTKILDDPIISEYVNRIGQNLARHSDVTFPVTVKIIESGQPNAFTLPGGHIFVDVALLRLTETEAELAAAISHELAHVAARHGTRQATQNQIANIATIPMMVLGGPIGAIARNAANIGIPMGFLKFSRVFENEADLLGLQYMYDAGYDPTASVDIFERFEALERKRPGTFAQLFNTHPITADRIQKTQKNIAALLPSKAEYVMNTSDYEDVRNRLIGLLDQRKAGAATEYRPTLKRPVEK